MNKRKKEKEREDGNGIMQAMETIKRKQVNKKSNQTKNQMNEIQRI